MKEFLQNMVGWLIMRREYKRQDFLTERKKLFNLIIAQGKWKSHESVWDAARQKCGFKCVGIAVKIYTTSTLDGHRIVVVVCTAGCYSFFRFMFQYLSETWQWLHRAWRNPGSSLAWGSAFAVPWVFFKKRKKGERREFLGGFFFHSCQDSPGDFFVSVVKKRRAVFLERRERRKSMKYDYE